MLGLGKPHSGEDKLHGEMAVHRQTAALRPGEAPGAVCREGVGATAGGRLHGYGGRSAVVRPARRGGRWGAAWAACGG